jgi:hypoxanthine phosphoribosyltransferase
MLSDFPVLDRPSSYLGYSQIGQWIDSLAETLRSAQFVAVTAVLRGGLFSAQCAAFATGAPLSFIRYDRDRQQAAWHGDPPPSGRLLLCEDIAGAGHTLVNCRELVRQTHPDHRILTIVCDELSRIEPDWSMRRPIVQTVLPWEREVVSPGFRQDCWHRDAADLSAHDHHWQAALRRRANARLAGRARLSWHGGAPSRSSNPHARRRVNRPL